MTEADEKKIKKDYKQGMKYNDIIKKYNITYSELRSVIRRNKLTRTKSKAQLGNKNAVGNNGGAPKENTNALTTGEYETIYKDVLEDDEIDLYNSLEVDDKEQLLINDYKILTIREKRMLTRIKNLKQQGKDMTIDFIRKKNTRTGKVTEETETITEAEPTINMIQRIEEGLTRVQDAKRKTLESLAKLNPSEEDRTLNVNLKNSSNPLLESINRQLGGNDDE